MNDRAIRILIIDDHIVVRRGLRALLATETDIEVVGEAEGGARGVELALRLQPDVVLMDLVMPGMDGTEAIRRIRAQAPTVRVLALTSFGIDGKLFPALDAGAVGYLLKDATAEDLVRSIRSAAADQATLHPAVAGRILRKSRGAPTTPPAQRLTARETEVLGQLAKGLANEDIADALVISVATVRTHVSNVLAKLNVDNRTQAALYALREGLATLEEGAA
jgi:NarL family two-component system response regulator LiaR